MARTTIRTEDITASEVTTAKMATDPTNASNLSSGSVPLAQLGNVDTSGITANQDDIALLGFKVAANGSLAKYNLIDQTIDAFEDASGIDASASTDEVRDASGNYYSGSQDVTVTSTGGTITTNGDYTIHKFTSDGTYETDVEQTDYELLLVGGGGAGGTLRGGGGGGGGGFNAQTDVTVTAATHAVVVGQGGVAPGSPWSASLTPATDSTFNDGATTWYGYKGGGGGRPDAPAGGTGYGSGGGGGASGGDTGGAANTENGSVGYAGGDKGVSLHVTGGGGGAGATGSNGNGSSGRGGAGATSDILITGSNVTYGGGGGGGNGDNGSAGSGGSGGGASGDGNNVSNQHAASGTDGLGGGGGGAGGAPGGNPSGGGDGGNGVVIIRRPTTGTTYNNMTLVSNATTAVDGAPTTGDLVITYTDFAGTATVNTDIKAYISRNGSAYTSAVTLVSQGTTGGHTILTANGVDLSGITTGTSMRWKIETLNQSASKGTRIHAVSLGWS